MFHQWVLVSTVVAVLLCFCLHFCGQIGFYFDLCHHCYIKTEKELKVHEAIANWEVDQASTPTTITPSSIYCTSSNKPNHPEYCRFESLCLKIDSNEYIFAFDQENSIFYPPELRVSQLKSYGILSSVSDHNLYNFDRIVTIPYSEIYSLNKTVVIVPGRTVIMSRFKPDNFMHLVHDDLIPLFFTMKQLGLNPMSDNVFFDDFWDQSLGSNILMQIFPNSLFKTKLNSSSIICFENAYIGILNSTIWYQYGFLKPQGPIKRDDEEIIFIRKVIHSFRKYLTTSFQLSDKCQLSKSLILIRSLNRRILNDAEFFDYLKSKFENLQSVILDDSTTNNIKKFQEFFQTFLCSDTLIGMHGSELIFSILMSQMLVSKPITVIELFPYGVEPNLITPFKTLAQVLKHRYFAWSNKIKANAIFHEKDYPPEWGGLLQLDKDEQIRISANIDESLKPFLCCTNPEWLYRIYQDTIVDLQSFDQFFQSIPRQFQLDNNEPFKVMQLSEVVNISCAATQSSLIITWQASWNIKLFQIYNVVFHYEVMVQCFASDHAALWNTDRTQLSVPRCPDSNGFNVWIKPTVATYQNYQMIGLFNKIPYVCQY